MLDTLKSLALKYTTASGNLTLWLLPFTSMRVNVAYDAMSGLVPRDQWTLPELMFANFNGFVLDVQVGKQASPIERVFGVLWEHRNEDIAARWELFRQLYSDGFYNAFDLAFEATRDHTFDAPADLNKPAENASPELSPATPLPQAS